MSCEIRNPQASHADTDSELRLEWASAAIFALEHCRPQHADAICAGWLEASETGGPQADVFGTLYADAQFWAVAAPPHELVAYTLAGLERLPGAHLSLPARKRVFKELWRSLTDGERAAFLKHVQRRAA
ncbi:hypothetical protein [Sediminimonas sp.]|uniref:hypothetical protein n=1 Tax=Sediminimonas sp. TaxID=2823379 RepID=UPI0025FC9E58|nr:hypothetical protein [Sediminimonas sp.]